MRHALALAALPMALAAGSGFDFAPDAAPGARWIVALVPEVNVARLQVEIAMSRSLRGSRPKGCGCWRASTMGSRSRAAAHLRRPAQRPPTRRPNDPGTSIPRASC